MIHDPEVRQRDDAAAWRANVSPATGGTNMALERMVSNWDGHGHTRRRRHQSRRPSITRRTLAQFAQRGRGLGLDVDSMKVEVTIGTPHPEKVDKAQVLAVLPHGTGTVTVVKGGLESPR